MEQYFGSAFPTVAATCVTHMQADENFLNREFPAASEDRNFAIDDFYRDVERQPEPKRLGPARASAFPPNHPLYLCPGVLGIRPRHPMRVADKNDQVRVRRPDLLSQSLRPIYRM